MIGGRCYCDVACLVPEILVVGGGCWRLLDELDEEGLQQKLLPTALQVVVKL